MNRTAERYERIGSENPTVGIASSWEHITAFFRDGENEVVKA